MKQRLILIILLGANSVYTFGQNSHENLFSRLTDQFCGCALKAKDKNEFEACGRILKAADSVQLTEADKIYFLDKLKTQCGEVFTKHWGPKRPSIPSCSFLQETDLKEFNLQKTEFNKTSVRWTNERDDGIILDITDERTQFTSESLAQDYIERQKKLTISDDFKRTILPSKIFQSIEIISIESFGNYHIYQIFARRDTLIYFLTVTLSKEDLPIIEKLVDKLGRRASNCQ